MVGSMKCAVILVIGPGSYGDKIARCRESITAAIEHDKGVFASIELVEANGSDGKLNRSQLINKTTESLREKNFDWFLLIDADSALFRETFTAYREGFNEFDALWGSIIEYDQNQKQYGKRENQLPQVSTLTEILFSHPYYTLDFPHFVRAESFYATRFDEAMTSGEDFDYVLRLWPQARCIKVDRPLSAFNKQRTASWGPKEGTKEWLYSVSTAFSKYFAENPVNMSFENNSHFYTFNITNSLEHIQAYHIRKSFFEIAELKYVTERLQPGAFVLDVGANIGNHVIFWAKSVADSNYICFEPNGPVADHLAKNLQLNSVDHRVQIIRKAVGENDGFVSIGDVDQLNEGATRVHLDQASDIPMVSLDTESAIPQDRIDFIKIDVEGFENEVLRGAQKLIEKHKPFLFVEVANDNKDEFHQLISSMNYFVDKEFKNVHASNFMCMSR